MSSLSPASDDPLNDLDVLSHLMEDAKDKAEELKYSAKEVESCSAKLRAHFLKVHNEVNETFQYFSSVLDAQKNEIVRELENIYANKQIALSMCGQKAKDTAKKIDQSNEMFDMLLKGAANNEIVLKKRPVEKKYSYIISAFSDAVSAFSSTKLDQLTDFEYVKPSHAVLHNAVKNNSGFIRIKNPENSKNSVGTKQPPISRPTSFLSSTSNITQNSIMSNGFNFSLGSSSCNLSNSPTTGIPFGSVGDSNLSSLGSAELLDSQGPQQTVSSSVEDYQLNSLSLADDDDLLASKFFNHSDSLITRFDGPLNGQKKMLNCKQPIFNGSMSLIEALNSSQGNPHLSKPMLDLSKLQSAIFPLKSQLRRQRMIYHCKFGEFGVSEGQFTEPSGVAVTPLNDIVVADTNNHRIQVFSKEGRYKFQFGECGKRDGQLLYPNRVAVVNQTGDIIVTERSPTHQVQIFNQYGRFIRKFGANILQYPRGVCVDHKGRIIVVECKVMRVVIFDQLGNVIKKFGCSNHLEFPNGVVVNDEQEIFISDNRAHCVKVFNYEGVYLRQIGGEGITNYPIGVGINSAGEVTIADNHNNFNMSVFSQDGTLLYALESKVKHAQCFDVSLMDDGSVVLASKDYRLYVYKYV